MKCIRLSKNNIDFPEFVSAEVYPAHTKSYKVTGLFERVYHFIKIHHKKGNPALVFMLKEYKPQKNLHTYKDIYFVGLQNFKIRMRNEGIFKWKKHAIVLNDCTISRPTEYVVIEEYRRMPKQFLLEWLELHKKISETLEHS